MTEAKSLGAAIDEIIAALSAIPEPSRVTAIRAACESLGIGLGGVNMPVGGPEQPDPVAPTGRSLDVPAAGTDIRSLKEQKNPATATEMALVLAYYLKHLAPMSERKSEITAADVNKYFVHADFPLPKRADQMLVNARASGYFDSPSRAVYSLNPVGHNLVAHSLPRSPGSSGAGASRTASKSASKRSGKQTATTFGTKKSNSRGKRRT